MPKSAIHSNRSTYWNSAEPRSKPNQTMSDRASAVSEVQSATQRAFRATCAASPLMKRMNNAPASGTKVMAERSGKLVMAGPSSLRLDEEVPGDEHHHPDQHGEGIVID